MKTKQFLSTAMILVFAFSLLILTSCNQEEILVTQYTQQIENENSTQLERVSAASSYFVYPTVGNFITSSSFTLNGSSGSFNGGVIKAKAIALSGSNMIIRMQPVTGTFTTAGTAYVSVASISGTNAGQKAYTKGSSYVDVFVTLTFTKGITHFYPKVITGNGLKYYTEPFITYTNPTCDMSGLYNGKILGTINGVNVYATGSTNANLTSSYQCVEFTARYYSQVYGMNVKTSNNNANNWYGTASSRGLKAYANKGTTIPRIGDILCFTGGSYGHVMIITEVGSTFVRVAHQNGGINTIAIGGTLTRSGNNITWGNYTCQGWLRKP